MAELKTKPTNNDVDAFLNTIDDETKRADAKTICQMMAEVSGEPAKMWGDAIVGFGSYHYKYASGHEGDATLMGFSPRKSNLTLYLMPGFGPHAELMKKLGKYKTGKACLYIKSLSDVDIDVLKQLMIQSLDCMKTKYLPQVQG